MTSNHITQTAHVCNASAYFLSQSMQKKKKKREERATKMIGKIGNGTNYGISNCYTKQAKKKNRCCKSQFRTRLVSCDQESIMLSLQQTNCNAVNVN